MGRETGSRRLPALAADPSQRRATVSALGIHELLLSLNYSTLLHPYTITISWD